MSVPGIATRAMPAARRFVVRGVVQGVGFRPFVFRLATSLGIGGWVLNGSDGVEIHAEGPEAALQIFEKTLADEAPPAARITSIGVSDAAPGAFTGFEIRGSAGHEGPTVRIAPDLPVCDDCLRELRDRGNRRASYPYINCTNCGPRYSIVLALPYDRERTTMGAWPMCEACRREYDDPRDRRFHAQPIACAECGPDYRLVPVVSGFSRTSDVRLKPDATEIAAAAALLREGRIVAIKGLGGYHLACDARNAATVAALRERKFRKERPFAVMVRDADALRALVEASPEAVGLAASAARPIVLAAARVTLPEVAPDNADLGVMLPYTPLHHLLYAAGAPDVLVMTSGNRSSEPIAYEDDDAVARLPGIADAFLIGGRPIARRVDDSVVHDGPFGPVIVRRARGYAPGAVAQLPIEQPLIALGADLKNTVTLVVNGTAFVSQHLGDLEHHAAATAFDQTIRDLLAMYDVDEEDLVVAHDAHPEYRSTARAAGIGAMQVAVQHHRAHVASVLAERAALATRVVGVALDGTGYGDDGTIWGGELFVGSVSDGFVRAGHLREAMLPGGDAAARVPVQAAAGFTAALDRVPDLTAPPFCFPSQYVAARRLIAAGVRVFRTTSVGRLFDTVAAVLGFVRPVTFEGQAAIWLEHRARRSATQWSLPFGYDHETGELDYREALAAAIDARLGGTDPCEIARAFHRGLAHGVADAAIDLAGRHDAEAVVLSGGVCQNVLLLADLRELFGRSAMPVWTNHEVPPNDGGVSLGQAAIAAVSTHNSATPNSQKEYDARP